MDSTNDSLAQLLYSASRDGQNSEVLDLLRRGAPTDHDWYRRVKVGCTPLDEACFRNHPLTALHLIQWGANLDSTSESGRTPLHKASRRNSPACVELLLQHNCRTDIKDSDGDTALDDARRKTHYAIVDTLMKHKPLPRDPLSSYPSVEQLCHLQVDKWYQLGIHLGVSEDLLQRIKDGQCPTAAALLDLKGESISLHSTAATLLAAKVNNIELRWLAIVEGLLSVGEGHSVLSVVSFYGWLSVIKNLVETKGLGPKGAVNKAGQTPLSLAYANRHLETVKYLVHEQQCDPNFVVNEAGDTPLTLECSRGDLEMVKALVNKKLDPKKPNKAGDTPISLASSNGHLDTVKYLAKVHHCDPNHSVNKAGDTPIKLAYRHYHWEVVKYLANSHHCDTKDCLLYAAEYDMQSDVEVLLNECHSNPNVMDEEGRTPLALTNDPAIIKLLLRHGAKVENVYKAHRKLIGKLSAERPPEIPLAIFITGDGGVGKSTLLKSMLSSPGLLARFTKPKPVTGVDEKTVGIIPYEILTKEFGRVTIYDFAGQQEFYASHSAILENAVQTSPPINVLCVNLQESEQKIADSTAWWMTLVQNQCKNLKSQGHVIVVGSHADILRENGEDPWDKETIFAPIIKKFPKFKFVAFLPMDCRLVGSYEIKQVKKYIQSSSAVLRSPEVLDFNAHMFQIYLLDSFKDLLAVPMKEVQSKIHQDLDDSTKSKEKQNLISFIPSTLPRLVEICGELSKKGLVLYLHNEASPEESFIVCNRATLLSKVNGTVFAPKGFRQHCKLASSTGVVPLFKFSDEFKSYCIAMLVSFMSHLELCFEIKDKEVLAFISKEEQNPDPDGRYLFFPGLIRIAIPERVWEQVSAMRYHFGWILQTTKSTDFFNPRSFQVLILRLVFAFRLAPSATIEDALPSLQRFCSVWKNGIFWCNDDGVTAHLELSDNGKSLAVKLRCTELKPECLEVRSKIISKVLETVKDLCPHIETTESIINPEQVVEHPLKPASSLTLSTVADTAAAVVSSKKEVKSLYGPQSLQQLLQFEPYAGLDSNTLQSICSDKSVTKSEKISDAFVTHFAAQVSDAERAHMYRGILSPPLVSRAQISQKTNPREEVVHSLERWRNEMEGTYTCLRETLNNFSVFSGRNPLDLAGVAHGEVDPSLLFPDPPSADTQQEPGTELLPLDKVREALNNVQPDWYSLAIELGIDLRTRKAIEKDNSTVEAKFDAMTQHWVRRTSPPPTWAALVGALKSPAIGREDIARKVLQDQIVQSDITEAALSEKSIPESFTDPLDVDSHLKMVRTVSWAVRVKWNNLGILLGIPEADRKAIEHDHRDVSGPCYTALLETWLMQSPTLGALIEALESPVIDHGDIARNIERMLIN